MDEVEIGTLSEFGDGECRVVAVGEFEVGVIRLGRKLVAYKNACPHYGGPVCQGKIFNRVEEMLAKDQTSRGLRFAAERHIVCPWHGYEFDIATGRHPGDPRVRLRPIAVRVKGDDLYLRLPD